MSIKKLEKLLGFRPSEEVIRYIHEKILGESLTFEKVDSIFKLSEKPNFQTGVILSAFDMCHVPITTYKQIELPEISVREEAKAGRPTSPRSFIDQYITEISVFPTLTREQEIEMAKLMEVAYIRYKASLCYCPAVLNWLDEKFTRIEDSGHKDGFDLPMFKSLVVPGSTKLSYPQLYIYFKRNWNLVRELRGMISVLEARILSGEKDRELLLQRDIYRFAVAFIVKDLNIREQHFHDYRDKLLNERSRYPEYARDIRLIDTKYQRYIECKNLLVNFNLKLVVSIARKFFRGSIAPMDIVQYGNQGLIRAAEDFNYKLNFKFSTYAIWWIRQKIQEGVQEQERLIRIPAYKLHLSRKFSAIRDRIYSEKNLLNDTEITSEEEEAMKAKDIPQAFIVSPQGSGGDEREGQSLEDIMDTTSLEDQKIYDEEAQQALRTHLRLYPVRERYILILRYGLVCEDIYPDQMTTEELEREFEQLTESLLENEDEIFLPDKQLDQEMPPISFLFVNLPTETRISYPIFKQAKIDKKLPLEVVEELLPELKGQREAILAKKKNKESLDFKETTFIALSDGIDFDEHITLKPRDRVVMKNVWLNKELKPSVARRIISGEGLILEDVANIFGLTKERVRQIESKILRHISYHLVLP